MIPGFQYLFKGPSVAALPDGKIAGLPDKLIGPEGLERQGLPKVVQAPTNEPLTVTNTRLRDSATGRYIPSNSPPPGIPVAQVAPPGATLGAPVALQNNLNNLQQNTPQPLPQAQVSGTKSPIPIPPTGPLPALVELVKAIRDKSASGLARAPVLYSLYRVTSNPGPQVGYGVDVLFPFTEELRYQALFNAVRIGALNAPINTPSVVDEIVELIVRIDEPTGVMHARDGA